MSTHHHDQELKFQRSAASYDAEVSKAWRTYRKKAGFVSERIEQLFPKGDCRILEIGCGTGRFTELLANQHPNCRFTATDAYPAVLELARKRLAAFPNVSVQRYQAESTFAGPQRFDVVCGVDVIHHLLDPSAAFRHWLRAASDSARLLFLESNPRNPFLYVRCRFRPEERRFFLNRPENLRRWLTEAGWQDARVESLPLYLPSGPRSLDRVADSLENRLHGRGWARPFSAMFLLEASASGSV